eukprot:gene555-594_t
MIYECPICEVEESHVVSASESAFLKCSLCGTSLRLKTATNSTPNQPRSIFRSSVDNRVLSMAGVRTDDIPSTDEFQGLDGNLSQLLSQINPDVLIDLFDPSLRDLFQQMLNDESPDKVVNQKYLDEIGLLKVDSRKTVLWDVSIQIGTVHSLFVLADFSVIPPANTEILTEIVLGNPTHGEVVDSGWIDEMSGLENVTVLLERGKITFAQKYQTFSSTPVHAVIISQTKGYKFPFIMTDSSKELEKINPAFVNNNHQTRCPVGMISERDAEVVKKLLLHEKKNQGKGGKVPIKIKVGGEVKECPICVENFECGEDIYKLPCRHIYHQNCLSRWVQSHPNCPLCRQPINKQEKVEEGKSDVALNPTEEMARNFYS